MRAGARDVETYLRELPDAWQALVVVLREIVLKHLPEGYVEAMRWGMISYEVPLEVSGKTYNGKPLMYAAIGAQKHHVALYLCGLYCHKDLRKHFDEAHAKAGIKLNMGKACLRLTKREQILESAIAEAIASTPPEAFIESSRH